MARHADPARARVWLWLLLLPLIALVWVPSYSRLDPQLFGFPFFYWYQLAWVLVSALITAFVYHKTKHSWAAQPKQEDGQ